MGRRQRDQERERLFTRRSLLLGFGQAGLFGALGARLYYLQVVEAEKYVTLAEDNRINMRLLVPPRGRILDRHGEVLATSRLNYRVVLVREQAPNVEATLDAIGKLITVGEADRRRVLRDVRRKRAFVPVMVREDLSWEEVARLEVNAPDLPGVSIDVGQSRLYPHTEAVGHILGYVGSVSEGDLKSGNGDPLLELPDFRIGKNGVEKTHDQALRGVAGASQVEVNSVGRVIREVSRDDGRPGRDVELTIDIGLQEFARERVGEESTAAVVIDCLNGEILAMVSAPAFDPNMFSAGLKATDWEELQSHPKTPLTNKAVAGQYSPGSTFKMVTALAALEAGVITPTQTVNCPGHFELGERRFHCWKYKGGHGGVNLADALMQSCDVYFYEIARRIGIDKIADMAQRLGLGAVQGIELPGERPGLIPTRAWYQRRRGASWPQGETINASIGQGMILTTPMQLATMTARIASGLAITPHLTRKIGGRAPLDRAHAPAAPLGLNPQHLALVQKGMSMVTNDQRGTGYKARILDPGLEMAGKSGTAQVRIITKAERDAGVKKNEDLPWRFRDHALFVGFAPVHNPRFACAVVVEHGGGGSSVAGPIVRDILLETQKRDLQRRLAGCPTCGGAHSG